MEEIILTGCKFVVLVIAMIVGRYLVPFIKSKLTASQLAILSTYVTYAVQYAEQAMKSEVGVQKKAEVLKLVMTKAKSIGLNISDDDINTLIESAVFEMNKAIKSGITEKETETSEVVTK